MKHPALSEIVSAIGLIAVLAVAVGVLLYSFGQQQEDTEEVISSQNEMSLLKASELLSSSNDHCNNNTLVFLLHNYAKIDYIPTNQIKGFIVNSDDESLVSSTPTFLDLNGYPLPDERIYNQTTVRGEVAMNCADGYGFVLITPSQEILRIRSWE